jgi:hypothetical protein
MNEIPLAAEALNLITDGSPAEKLEAEIKFKIDKANDYMKRAYEWLEAAAILKQETINLEVALALLPKSKK